MKSSAIAAVCITIFILSACKKKTATEIVNISGNDVYITHVDEITDTIVLKLSDMVESCETIIPETTEESLLSGVNRIAVSENYIAIKGGGKTPLKLFSRDGKYLRDIGSVGRGPDEYNISLYGVKIDEQRDNFYLIPFANADKILVFGKDGTAKKHIPLRFRQRKFKAYIEDDTITIMGMPFKNDTAVVFQQNREGELIQYIAPAQHQIAMEFSSEVSSSGHSGKYDLFQMIFDGESPDDTLYYYNTKENRLIPKFTLDFAEEERAIYACYDLPRHYRAWIRGLGNILVDKKSLETNYYKLENDFLGGIPIDFHWECSDDWFIAAIPAFKLKQEIEICLSKNQTEDIRMKLTELNAKINESTNDILFIGKLNH